MSTLVCFKFKKLLYSVLTKVHLVNKSLPVFIGRSGTQQGRNVTVQSQVLTTEEL